MGAAVPSATLLPLPAERGRAVEDLDLDIRPEDFQRPAIGGRRRSSASGAVSRQLTPADLASLDGARGAAAQTSVGKIREAHHSVARMIADGRPQIEIGAITGYGSSRIWALQQDPAFQELVAFYQKNKEAAYADLHQRLAALGLSATAELLERLASEPEKLSDETLKEIIKLSADRTGHGPQSKATHVHLHAEMGDRLARARQRAQQHQAQRAEQGSDGVRTIDGEVSDVRLLPSA